MTQERPLVSKLGLLEGARMAANVVGGGPKALINEKTLAVNESLYFQWPFLMSKALRVSEGIFVVLSGQDTKDILVGHNDIVSKETRDFRIIREFLGNSLVPVRGGTEWQERRKLIMPAFSHAKVRLFGENIVKEAQTFLYTNRGESHKEIPLHPSMALLTLRVITSFMFGEELPEREITEIGKHVSTLAQHTSNRVRHMGLPPKWFPSRGNNHFKESLSGLNRILDRIYEKRLLGKGTQGEDMLSILINARHADDSRPLTKREILDESLSMLIAGHETTANALTWAFYLLSENPVVQTKVRDEIRSVVGSEKLSIEHLRDLKLVEWVIKEALRLYPPVWVFSRKSLETIKLSGGREIPPKTFIAILPWLIHRNASLWNNPEEFNPYRFDPKNPDLGVRDAFIPFGVGQRRCIGADLALTEAKLVLGTVLQNHEIKISEKVDPALLITTRPSTEVRASLEAIT